MNGILPLPHGEVTQLQFKDLGFGHEGAGRLLINVNFTFPRVPMVHVRGAEGGAGITTLLRLLAGMEVPSQGEYLINGRDVDSLSRTERAALQLSFGYSFHHGGLLSNYTLLDNLMLPMNYHQVVARADRESRALSYLRHFGMERYANMLPAFATATARKVCVLARAFLLGPRVLFLDEPTEAIHQSGSEHLVELIRYHQKHLGLQQVYFATEDERFLKAFDFDTVEIAQKGLIQR